MSAEISSTFRSQPPCDELTSRSRYRLLALVASGGMGSVYLARPKDKRDELVAIKRAHPHLVNDPVFERMFLAEAQLSSCIHHPNVVGVRGVEHLDGELFLVMDYVDGGSLSDLVAAADKRSAPLDPRVALRIVLDAAAGLQAAHELVGEDGKPRGVVHRDISPHNILVGVDGVARIADFGLAKCAPALSNVTRSMGLKGKLGYMAPEYVRDQSFDARSDVFALGVVAWQALTGKRLFQAANEVATLNRVLGLRPRRPSEVRPELPASLDRVILRALEKHPDARWPTARAFSEALSRCARADVASHAEVGACVQGLLGETLERRHSEIHEVEAAPEVQPEEDYRTVSVPLPGPSSSFVGAVAMPVSSPRRGPRTWLSPALAAMTVVVMLGLGVRVTLAGDDGRVALAAQRPGPATSVAAHFTEEPSLLAGAAALATAAPTAPQPGPSPMAAQRPGLAPRRAETKSRPARATRPAPDRAIAAPNPYGPPPKA